jgi:hypothetical protein
MHSEGGRSSPGGPGFLACTQLSYIYTRRMARKPPESPAPPEPTPDLLLQVRIPAHIRKALDHRSIDSGESLRTLVLRGIKSLGIEVTDEELRDRRGRRS